MNHNAPGYEQRSQASRVISHRFWIVLGCLVSVIGLVAAVVGFLVTRTTSTAADLEVAAVSMDQIVDLEYTAIYPDGFDKPVAAAPLDITLKNNGDEPIRITKILGEVIDFQKLEPCRTGGASDPEVSASYTLKVSTERKPIDSAGGGGLVVTDNRPTAPVDFVVKPGTADRMEVSFGFDEEQVGGVPSIVVVKVSLVTEDGDVLEVGTAAGGINQAHVREVTEFYASSYGNECAVRNTETLDQALGLSTVHSPLFDELLSALRSLN